MVLLLVYAGACIITPVVGIAQLQENSPQKHPTLYWLSIGIGGASIPEVQTLEGNVLFRAVAAWDNSSLSAEVQSTFNGLQINPLSSWSEVGATMFSLMYGRQLWHPMEQGTWMLRAAVGPAYIDHTVSEHSLFVNEIVTERKQFGLAVELEGLIYPKIMGVGLSSHLYVTPHMVIATMTLNVSLGKFE